MKRFLIVLITILCIILAASLVLLFVLEHSGSELAGLQMNTWEEFQALSEEDQMRFIDSFGDGDGFEQWMNSVCPPQEATLPWENEGAKPVEEYTWEEFESLEQQQQEIFVDSFDNDNAFEQWLERENPQEELEVPTLSFADKKPEEYIWEEFEALDQQQQEQFIDGFAGEMTFEQWLEREKPQEIWNDPWQEDGSKKPEDYTWTDFSEMTEEDQMAFIDYMDARDGFEKWMEANKPKD